MPIILDDLDLADVTVSAAVKAADPKFFSSKLTGNGKKTGLLNQNLLPVNRATNVNYTPHDYIEAKASYTQHGITTSMIPFAPLTRRCLQSGPAFTLPVPHPDDRFVVGTQQSPTAGGWDVYFDMTPQAAVLYEDGSGDRVQRDLVVQYRMELFFLASGAATEPERVAVVHPQTALRIRLNEPGVALEWSTSPLETARDFIEAHLDYVTGNTTLANPDKLDEWLRNYDIYERIARQAQIWDSVQVADAIGHYITAIARASNPFTSTKLNGLAELLRYLENYNVPLEAYRLIHQAIEATFTSDVSAELAKQNLNLLMNHTLDQLERLKPQLTVPVPPAQPPVLPDHLSLQQLEALTTSEPLVMTQAGAGTGKSTVILQRINYLRQCGVPSSDITVLSFTNAAADNITAKNPDVGSMTIARMIHDIYSLNHPGHELSGIDTIINSLDIFFPADQFAATFRQHLMRVDKNETHSFTAMNTFIERHYDQVIMVLDKIKQTSLELEIIICYQQIDTMAEPAHVQSQYLIIDEVQDNSIFEFIYVLKYVTKHVQSLFVVGDASQTLYEFRSANPRALNTLESSGVFKTYRLTTNYRSNQEILDFANVVLGQLETNQFANIQLQANDLAVPTADSFQEKVKVDYRYYARVREFNAELGGIVRNTVIPEYVDKCLARGEQVAFLAYTRREIATVQAVLEEVYPQRHVASLVSDRVYSTDIFSTYIKTFWNDVLQVPPANAAFVVSTGIRDNLEKLTRNAAAAEKAIMKMISNWWLENNAAIAAWVQLTQLGSLSHDAFFERLRDNLLSFEIRHNAVRQSLMNQKNRERKLKNAESKSELVVSTIHGAKGMEFDNVVVLHKEDTQMSEDVKRMYYVAFTRAMNTEYVLSHGTVKNAPIESNHQALVKVLERRDYLSLVRRAGLDPDDLEQLNEEERAAMIENTLAQLDQAAAGPAGDPDGLVDQMIREQTDMSIDKAIAAAVGDAAQPDAPADDAGAVEA